MLDAKYASNKMIEDNIIVEDNNYLDTYKMIKESKLNDKTISITGIIIKKDNDYYIGKYLVTCCIADATFLAIPITEEDYIDNHTYQIDGHLKEIDNNLIIEVDRIIDNGIENIYIYSNNSNYIYYLLAYIAIIYLIIKKSRKEE